MKLYTEEQLLNTVEAIRQYTNIYNEKNADDMIEKHLKALEPIQEISDEEIEKQAEYYAHNYFDMHEQNNYIALKQGFLACAKWYREQLKSKQ